MNPLAVKALTSILRFVLAGLTGWLVTKKVWSEADWTQYIEAGALFLVTMGWSVWEKYKGLVLIQAARILPKHASMTQIEAVAKSGMVDTEGTTAKYAQNVPPPPGTVGGNETLGQIR